MNAYKLSDELENAKSISKIARLVKEQTIPMLRQLQDDLSDLQRHIPVKTEPVAWMNSKGDIILPAHQANKEYNIPLYTHPVKDLANALTDKEITKLWCEVFNFPNYDCLTELDFKFCREIIRKAQEK